MAEEVLFVDDEEYVLNAVERLFSGNGMNILKASSGNEALSILKEEDIAVLVSDNLMPGMRGVELLARVRDISPDTVRILMTAHADLSTAMEAINRGEVFRFLLKPWDDEELVETVREGLARYRLIHSLKRADEATLLSLAQTIELKDPYTRGHCDRVARYALMIADRLNMPDERKRLIKYGSWLHDCGKIGVPESILNFSGPLEDKQMEEIRKHPQWGAEVARQARLDEAVVNIILRHHERWDGRGYPGGMAGEKIPEEARIVSVADVYDALVTDRPYRKGFSICRALEILKNMKGRELDPRMVDLFLASFEEHKIHTHTTTFHQGARHA